MRLAATLLALAAPLPTLAWEFTPVPVCTLSHSEADGDVKVTYDPRKAQPYTIALSKAQPWPDASSFSIRFDGPGGLIISTDRHQLSEDGLTLSVSDRGFGNVLNGLAFNSSATALADDQALTVSLDGAGPEVEAFKACIAAPTA